MEAEEYHGFVVGTDATDTMEEYTEIVACISSRPRSPSICRS